MAEVKRYQSKGYGAVIAILLNCVFVYLWPIVTEKYWHWSLDYMAANDISMSVFYIVHGTVLGWIVSITCQLACYLIYHLEWDMFERYKVLEDPWPWKSNPDEWWAFLMKTFRVHGFNLFILGPLSFCVYLLIDANEAMDCTRDGLPSRYQFVLQIIFCMLLEDLGFHVFHRMLHWPSLYPYVHKIHHEYKVSVAITSNYMHPMEFLLLISPVQFGPMILGKHLHIMTSITWFGIRTFESIEGHCGYEFSWSPVRIIPFAADYGYHAYHHSHNVGNYSTFFSLWDTILGSNRQYYKFLQEVEERESLKAVKVSPKRTRKAASP